MHTEGCLFPIYGSAYKSRHGVSESPAPNPMRSSLSFQFRRAVISSGKSVGGKGERVCAFGGSSGPLARSGADCVGGCCLMRPALFFFNFFFLLVACTSHRPHKAGRAVTPDQREKGRL